MSLLSLLMPSKAQNVQLNMCISSTKNVGQRLIFFLSLAVSNVRISFGHKSLKQTSRSPFSHFFHGNQLTSKSSLEDILLSTSNFQKRLALCILLSLILTPYSKSYILWFFVIKKVTSGSHYTSATRTTIKVTNSIWFTKFATRSNI